MKKLIIFLLVCIASGCAQTIIVSNEIANEGSEFGEESALYIFRVEKKFGPTFAKWVVVDQKRTAILEQGDYVSFPISKGRHIVYFDCNFPCYDGNKFQINIDQGKTYYLFYGEQMQAAYATPVSIPVVTNYLRYIPKIQAEQYMQTYRKVPRKSI